MTHIIHRRLLKYSKNKTSWNDAKNEWFDTDINLINPEKDEVHGEFLGKNYSNYTALFD